MARDPVILVSGSGRCGSSLVMQMLHRGGVACTGQWPAFEDLRSGHDTFEPAWVARQHGQAVKLLDPIDLAPRLQAGAYLVIWLDRDAGQQARSHAKFLHQVMGLPLSRADRRAYERSLRRGRAGAVDAVRALGPTLRLRFEDLLANPLAGAHQLAEHIGTSCAEDMARAVQARSGAVAPDFALELSLTEEGSLP